MPPFEQDRWPCAQRLCERGCCIVAASLREKIIRGFLDGSVFTSKKTFEDSSPLIAPLFQRYPGRTRGRKFSGLASQGRER